jgi:hypothetical protein
MEKLKIRKVKGPGELCYAFGVIDTCENILDREAKNERYRLGFKFRDENTLKLRPLEDISCFDNQLDMCRDDIFSKVNMHEYILFSIILRRNGFIFK